VRIKEGEEVFVVFPKNDQEEKNEEGETDEKKRRGNIGDLNLLT
jgi:hypothetical protein